MYRPSKSTSTDLFSHRKFVLSVDLLNEMRAKQDGNQREKENKKVNQSGTPAQMRDDRRRKGERLTIEHR